MRESKTRSITMSDETYEMGRKKADQSGLSLSSYITLVIRTDYNKKR